MRKFAVFDIDGTVFRSHLYYDVVRGMAARQKLHPKLNDQVLKLYKAWEKREYKDSFEVFDKGTITAFIGVLEELNPQDYDKIMPEIIKPLLDHTYLYARSLIKELRDKNYFLIALSGARKEELEIFASYHGFDDWVGAIYERSPDGRRYTGKVIMTHKDKHLILDRLVKKHGLTYKGSYGIGDTLGDASMLEAVEKPIAFNPNEKLLKVARKKGWKIVIERKNVIYHMESKNGVYRLAKTDS